MAARAAARRRRRPGVDVAGDAELADDLSLAFLVVLERLTPDERAVFLLREAFDYKFAEIAEIVGKSPANCRQIGARARRHVLTERPRFEPSRAAREELAARFLAAAQGDDLDGLIELSPTTRSSPATAAARRRRSRSRWSARSASPTPFARSSARPPVATTR